MTMTKEKFKMLFMLGGAAIMALFGASKAGRIADPVWELGGQIEEVRKGLKEGGETETK